jgi:tetratricopeptide (TPR) repeat protein
MEHRDLEDLAWDRQAAGLLDEAIPLWESLLAERARTLGDGHPETLDARNYLAGAYHLVGRLGEAVELFERNLADRERVLGGDHPDTVLSRNNLAWALYMPRLHGRMRTPEEASARLERVSGLFERVLADRERLQGPKHPHTVAARYNLGIVYAQFERSQEAIAQFERALNDWDAVPDDDSLDRYLARVALADLYWTEQYRLDAAIPLLEAALAGLEESAGAGHPDTVATREYLAIARAEAAPPEPRRWPWIRRRGS